MATAPTIAAPPRESDIIRQSLALIVARLPETWSSQAREDITADAAGIDAVVDLLSPDGAKVRLLVQAKSTVEPKDISDLASRAAALAVPARGREPATIPVLVARYLSEPVRERLANAGLSYADVTGNIMIRLDRPALFIRDVGASSDPWRGPGRPRGSLKGATAARLVRALADFTPPFSVPDLARTSGASIGATYRMIEFLESEALVTREPRSPITAVDWRAIIERWAEDLGVGQTERMALYLEPRGLPALPRDCLHRGIGAALHDARGHAGRLALGHHLFRRTGFSPFFDDRVKLRTVAQTQLETGKTPIAH